MSVLETIQEGAKLITLAPSRRPVSQAPRLRVEIGSSMEDWAKVRADLTKSFLKIGSLIQGDK
jgi:hypothetical protein